MSRVSRPRHGRPVVFVHLDYQNRRPEYANTVIDNLLSWGFAERNLERILTTA